MHVLSPEEIAELYRTALANTDNPQEAQRCVEAYLAGQDKLLPKAPRGKAAIPERFVVFGTIEDGTEHRYCVPCDRDTAGRIANELRASGRRNVRIEEVTT